MNQFFLIFICFITTLLAKAQNPKPEWVKTLGGIGLDGVYGMTTDALGNVYSTGVFSNLVDFDPSDTGNYSLASVGYQDIFVLKLDASGKFVWARRFGGINYDGPNSIAVDATGSVFVAGVFQATVDFDPGPGTSTLISKGGNDAFFLKLNSSGDFLWAKGIGGTLSDIGISIVTDNTGNVLAGVGFEGTVDFDPGAGVSNFGSFGNRDMGLVKLNSSGNFIWAKQLGGIAIDNIQAIALDASANIFVTGQFDSTVDFDPGVNTFNLTAHSTDMYILKLDSSGDYIWAKSIGGYGYDHGFALTLDGSGNIYTTGIFSGTVDFDPGTDTSNLISNGASDNFILKLNASGNLVWAKGYGGPEREESYAIALDPLGNIYTSGVFKGTADFNPGTGTANLTTLGAGAGYLMKLNATGNFIWAVQMESSDYVYARNIKVDASGDLYVNGGFRGTVDLDPTSGIIEFTTSSVGDVYIGRYSQTYNGIKKLYSSISNYSIYPNPTNGNLSIKTNNLQEQQYFEINDNMGRLVYSKIFSENEEFLNFSEQPAGVYLVKIYTKVGIVAVMKLVKSF